MGKVTRIILDEPLERKSLIPGLGTMIEELDFREAKLHDLFDLDFTGADAHRSSCKLISRLSSVDEKIIQKMSLTDYAKCSEVLGALMGSRS